MFAAILLLLGFALAGDVIARLLPLAIPGPVLGMVLLLCAFTVRPALVARVSPASSPLLVRLSLLFVPAGVGVMEYGDVLHRAWFTIGAAIAGSTLLTIVVTSGVMLAVDRIVRTRR